MTIVRSKTYVYTTGDVAKICNISVITVCKLFDRGELKGYKLLKRGDRRILEKNLVEFMMKEKIPIPFDIEERHNRGNIFGIGIPKNDSFVFFKDKNDWCCVRPNFINLQESVAGFGSTLHEAHVDYLKKANFSGIK